MPWYRTIGILNTAICEKAPKARNIETSTSIETALSCNVSSVRTENTSTSSLSESYQQQWTGDLFVEIAENGHSRVLLIVEYYEIEIGIRVIILFLFQRGSLFH